MSIANRIFGFLHTQTSRTFGEGSFLFFPAERRGTSYTVVLPCTAAANRGRANAAAGLLTMPSDTRTFHIAAEGLPFEPRPEDIIQYGPAVRDPANPGQYMADPDNPPRKYRITSADKATFHEHWRIEAEVHA
jgi:hypothetical protein